MRGELYENANDVDGFYPNYQQDWLVAHHGIVINRPKSGSYLHGCSYGRS